MSAMCTTPLADETLLAWWAGELTALEEERLEEHLLSCHGCVERGQRLADLAHGLQRLLRTGGLSVVVLPEVVERLEREGRQIREYRVRPGGGVQCTVSPDDDLVLARLAADLGGVSRLDVTIRIGEGPEERLPDILFDPDAGELLFAPSADALRALPAHVQRMRLLAVDAEGDRVLGEYTFDHTPWPGT
jgi:hypothetical protein